MQWTSERVLALAPDSSSVKAVKKLSTLSKWSNLGDNARALWGECKGSGSKPYLTQIDLEGGPSFKCSCPSRKFPCKHGLALFLLRVDQAGAFGSGEPPDWVSEWLEERSKRDETQAKRAETKAKKDADPEATAKRAEKREANIQAGVRDLERWLCDLVRRGLASVQREPYAFWDEMASRMVDAQAPGLANRLRVLGGLAVRGEAQVDVLLEHLGLLHLLLEGYSRIDTLAQALQADIRTQLGLTQDQNALLQQPGIRDRWQVLGQASENENNLTARRSWLRGERSGRTVFVLDFAYGGAFTDESLLVNTAFEGELVLFEGHAPQRALVKTWEESEVLSSFSAEMDILNGTAHYAQALAAQPWLTRYPLALEEVQLIPTCGEKSETWLLTDASHQLPVHPDFAQGWTLPAVSGGQPLTLFGEWDGRAFLPLAASLTDKTVRLHG